MARDIVVIGGSAGALAPVQEILRALPSNFPAALFVVLHSSPTTPGILPTLLKSDLSIAYAHDGEPIRPGHVFLAPRDRHLLVEAGRVRVTRGPRENGFRPAVDPLFRTAAREYGPRVVGVILSGGLDDGTHGLALVKGHGGVAVVQEVEDASATGMPQSAIQHVDVDHVVKAPAIPGVLAKVVAEPAPADVPCPSAPPGPESADEGLRALAEGDFRGPPSPFICPECGGPLWETANGRVLRFTCHVGHAYGPEALASGMNAGLESALWTALRALEENAAFFRRMEGRAEARNLTAIASRFGNRAIDVEQRAEIVRSALVSEPVTSEVD